MKKQLLIFAVLINCFVFTANAFEVDGIYYNITSSTAPLTVEVTFSTVKYSGAVVIPSSVTYDTNNYSVTSIGSRSFHNCSSLTSITIPNSITTIGDSVFYNCSSLTSITIPNSVTSIGNRSFYSCSSLTSITISNSVSSIGSYAFQNCGNLASITIPNSVTSIIIPNSVTSIGRSAFTNTPWYNNIPNGVVYINNILYIYKGIMPDNTVINIQEGTVSISDYAFASCSGLTSIILPNSVTSIGNYAFAYCSGLNSIILPNSVKSIGDDAFLYCSGLNSIILPNSVKSIGDDAFLYCSGLTSIIMSNSVKSIGNYAFAYCSGLTSIIMSNSVKSIGNYTFAYCSSLTSITIPDSVTSIGGRAFYGCSRLSSITSNAIVPPAIYDNTFVSVPNNIPVYIPCGTYRDYLTSAWENYFTSFVAEGMTTSSFDKTICYGTTYTDENFNNLDTIGIYPAYITNANGCDSVITLNLSITDLTPTQSICMVSVDDNNHNQVVVKRNEEVVSYNIYKEGAQNGQYDFVANVPYDAENLWTDSASNAKIRSYRYKVSAVDTCGNESYLSNAHKTMHLTLNQGQNNTWNLIWTAYEGVGYQTYNIYRSSGDSNEMELIGTMPSGNTSFSDFSAPAGYVYYVVEIVLDEACVSAPVGIRQKAPTTSTFGTSIRSNIVTNNPNPNAINVVSASNISIFPNPATNQITINGVENGENIAISDLSGRTLRNYDLQITNYGVATVNISNLASGVYLVRVGNNIAKLVKK